MKKANYIVALSILLALTACSLHDSVPQAPALEESSPGQTTPSAPESEPEEIPAENRIAAITPANGERIREKKAENENAVGWLTVPGTDIDSVIVQAPADDNGFYTNHDLAGKPSKDGAYFTDMRCDFTTPTREGISQNIALYGNSGTKTRTDNYLHSSNDSKIRILQRLTPTSSFPPKWRTWFGRCSRSITSRLINPTSSPTCRGPRSARCWILCMTHPSTITVSD